MATDLAIRAYQSWFLSSRYRTDGSTRKEGRSLSHRLVICRAILSYRGQVVDRSLRRATDIPTLLQWVLGQVSDREPTPTIPDDHERFFKNHFMEVFRLTDGNGLVVVDQTQGCFPMLLYAEKARPDSDPDERVSAFVESVKAVRDGWARIGAFLELHRVTAWNEALQREILREIPEPKPLPEARPLRRSA